MNLPHFKFSTGPEGGGWICVGVIAHWAYWVAGAVVLAWWLT